MKIRRNIVAVAAGIIALAAACAPLPSEQHPRVINPDKVPDLFPTTSTSEPTSGVIAQVCFVQQSKDGPTIPAADDQGDDSDVICVAMNVESRTPRALIDALAAGPGEQPDIALTSSVPQNTRLLDASSTTGTTLTINLSSAINDVSSPNNTLAYHQIVETLTHPSNGLGVDRVRVLVDGKQTKIPTDAGAKDVATPDDFNRGTSTASTTAAPRTG